MDLASLILFNGMISMENNGVFIPYTDSASTGCWFVESHDRALLIFFQNKLFLHPAHVSYLFSIYYQLQLRGSVVVSVFLAPCEWRAIYGVLFRLS